MKHLASPDFWACYRTLPQEIRTLADRRFALLKKNPQHPSLHLKRAGRFWSVRVGLHYRALGLAVSEGVLWFWVGSHAEYDKIVG